MYFNFVNLYYLEKGMLCLFIYLKYLYTYIYFKLYLLSIFVIRYRLYIDYPK